eukprot:350149-Chlamydomonas_euryale.AAC.13
MQAKFWTSLYRHWECLVPRLSLAAAVSQRPDRFVHAYFVSNLTVWQTKVSPGKRHVCLLGRGSSSHVQMNWPAMASTLTINWQ